MKKKGVSQIIAVLLMLIITVSLAVIIWAFIFGVFQSRTTVFDVMDISSRFLLIKNIGTKKIEQFDVRVDEKQVPSLILGNNVVYQEDFTSGAGSWSGLPPQWSLSSDSYQADGSSGRVESSIPVSFDRGAISYKLRFGVIKPNDVILIIDRSTSMSVNGKFVGAKNAAKQFVDNLNADDRAGVVFFCNVLPPVTFPLAYDKTQVKDFIDSMTTTCDGTAIGDSIQSANGLLTSQGRSSATWSEILLSDGVRKGGVDPISQADIAASIGIVIFTIGLGDEIDEPLMMQIAAITGGTYYPAPTPSDLSSIYQSIVESLSPGISSLIIKNSLGPIVEIKFLMDPDKIQMSETSDGSLIAENDQVDFQTNVWYDIRIVVSDSALVLYIDNSLVLSGTPTQLSGQKSEITLTAENGFMFFDNFVITESAVIEPGASATIEILEDILLGPHKILLCSSGFCSRFNIDVK